MTRSWTVQDAAHAIRRPTRTDHKYSRGVLGMRSGSEAYPGAAVLGVEAAWRTGLGMVRYVGPPRPTQLVLARRPETVTVEGRVQAWVLGSGTDASSRDPEETSALRRLLDGAEPVVVDAGALDLAVGAAAPRILTPHEREHTRLRETLGLNPMPHDLVAEARETAAVTGAVVLLKGATTIVTAPGGWSATVEAGTPWLATAGTGDVLAGVVGALVAGAEASGRGTDAAALAALAASGAWLHGRAATLAAESVGDGPITALDVAAALPRAVSEALGQR
jgi:hydroxyethylthiazole kinase-like uncharacterized protein yjeF